MRSALSGLCFLCALTLNAFSQNTQPFIRGCLPEIKENKIYLEAFYGSSAFMVDSSYADVNGCFILTPPLNRQGLYRVLFPKRRFMDIIFSHKNVYFHSSLDAIIDSTQFIDDTENQLYYTYLQHRLQLSGVRHELLLMLNQSDTAGVTYKNARRAFLQLQREDAALITRLSAQHPASLTALLIGIDRSAPYDPSWSKAVKDRYRFDHFLDYADFTDSALLYTNALSAKMISYLDQAIRIDEDKNINKEFLEASVKLLAASGYSRPVFNFVHDYLIGGFSRLELDSLSKAIDSITYPCCICSEPATLNRNGASIINQRLPKLKLFNEKEKIGLPNKGNSYILLFINAACPWNEKLMKELNNALLLKSLSERYIPIIINLSTSAEKSQSQPSFQLTKRSADKLQKEELLNTWFPEVWIIDEAGNIQEVMPNWVVFRRWIMSKFPS